MAVNSGKGRPVYCYFHKIKTMYSFTCVCHHNYKKQQENCKIPENKRICAFDMTNSTANATAVMKDIWIKEQCEFYFISESNENVSISIPNFALISNSSSNGTCDHYQAEEWCSKIGTRKSYYETFKACCNQTDFCNKMMVIELKEVKGDMMRSPFTCNYAAKGIAILNGTCELYMDLMTKNLVVLNEYVFQEFNK
uniref:Uncharacterized protein n=1 Tax=Panagrolaimus davidi TaxID=227884 RepID=A0A914Q9L6_9BILA